MPYGTLLLRSLSYWKRRIVQEQKKEKKEIVFWFSILSRIFTNVLTHTRDDGKPGDLRMAQ
jgi:hypothetical protein